MTEIHQNMLITHTFDAPRERVWDAWTDPNHLSKWWGPQHFTNPVCQLELWPGGTIRIDMTAPDGRVFPMGGTIHEVEKPHKLVFTSTALNDEKGEPQLVALNTVTFEDEDGKTKVTISSSISKAEGPALDALKGQTVRWNQSLDKLDTLLGKEDIFLGGKYPNEFINF